MGGISRLSLCEVGDAERIRLGLGPQLTLRNGIRRSVGRRVISKESGKVGTEESDALGRVEGS